MVPRVIRMLIKAFKVNLKKVPQTPSLKTEIPTYFLVLAQLLDQTFGSQPCQNKRNLEKKGVVPVKNYVPGMQFCSGKP